jgi:hypothetical protein
LCTRDRTIRMTKQFVKRYQNPHGVSTASLFCVLAK